MAQLTIKQSINKIYYQQPVIKEDNPNTKNTKHHGQRFIEKTNCRTR